jgi:hypothetical protein
MAVEKVQLGVSAIKELLDNGYTWLKKDDLGYGSIQEKYQASEVQIGAIRKHPALKNLETTARIFVIIDDTKSTNDTTLETTESVPSGTSDSTHEPKVSMASQSTAVETDADSFSAFANL